MTDRQSTTRVRSGSKGIPGGRPGAVRIKLLGGFSVSVGSRTIAANEWRLRKAAALIKVISFTPDHRLHRDLLWPTLGTRAAANNLRGALHVARRALDPDAGSRYLAPEDESLVLCPAFDLWMDVEALEQATATARCS